ncbi:histidine phosphatase family protein [Bowmanella dokdonensis]|uniref:Histidine phosphatase family protein n=1 Tax=Bowmanella dokdonensis TaxID=751969 RepID=A0A939DNI1_9ALTE|nr:histidine phosphatase family protein [Bowmanella dokdonensis]MBN7825036.1 histidine phosphatase family protein [Bowmanella dokdonensis]
MTIRYLHLVRHGQAASDLHQYDDLSALGHRQMQHLGRQMQDLLEQARFHCGSLRRQQQSGQAFLNGAGLSQQVRLCDDFDEFDFLDVLFCVRPQWRDPAQMQKTLQEEAEPEQAFMQIFKQAMQRWVSGTEQGDYKESWQAFSARTHRGMQALTTDSHHWVFTSGGVIAALTAAAMKLDGIQAIHLNSRIANGSVTSFLSVGDRWRLLTFNQIQHFLPHPELLTFR